MNDQKNEPAAHTPLPWMTDGTDTGEYMRPKVEIYYQAPYQNDGSRYHIIDVVYPSTARDTVGSDERKANAAFIVEACNNYGALKAREADLLAVLENIMQYCAVQGSKVESIALCCAAAIKKARATGKGGVDNRPSLDLSPVNQEADDAVMLKKIWGEK